MRGYSTREVIPCEFARSLVAVPRRRLSSQSCPYSSIVPGAVGIVRANTGQLQVRLSSGCDTGTAIGGVDRAGKVTCNPARPGEFATSGSQALGTGSTQVATVGLPGGSSYVSFATRPPARSGGMNHRPTGVGSRYVHSQYEHHPRHDRG